MKKILLSIVLLLALLVLGLPGASIVPAVSQHSRRPWHDHYRGSVSQSSTPYYPFTTNEGTAGGPASDRTGNPRCHFSDRRAAVCYRC